jgi:hypothetical protein
MDRDEPQMCQRSFQDRVDVVVTVEPIEKGFHFRVEPVGGGGLVMYAFMSLGAGDNPHRPRRVVAPRSDDDLSHAAATSRKQRCMPTKPPLCGEFVAEFLRGVEHHLDDTFDVAVDRRQGRSLDSQAAGNRGPNLAPVQDLAFDLAGLEHVFGQRLENGLLAQRKAERVHATYQLSLSMPDRRKLPG